MASAFRVGGLVILVLLLVDEGWIRAETKKTTISSQPRVQKFDEIERGFWIRSSFGMSITSQNPFKDKSRKNPAWPPGGAFGLEMGYDFGQVASIHVAACGMHLNGYQIIDKEKRNVPSDVGVYMITLGTRFNLATTKRTAWFIKAGAGYLMARPKGTTLDDGLAVQAGTGIEYATNLRHFFVGLEAVADYFVESKGIVYTLTPIVKYSF